MHIKYALWNDRIVIIKDWDITGLFMTIDELSIYKLFLRNYTHKFSRYAYEAN